MSMKPSSLRTKTVLVILGTLCLGAAIGSLGTGRIVQSRVEDLNRLRSDRGFVEIMEEVVQPENEAQRQQIHAILTETDERLDSLRREEGMKRAAVFQSMRAELIPVLNAEQQQRLIEWEGRFKIRIRRPGEPEGEDPRVAPPSSAPEQQP
jgi:hypothetical protein